jgi:ClpP class serine protease
VAEGRRAQGLTAARVDEIGQGHIWTGALAQGLGLVDRMGGLSAAVDEAARLARVPVGRDRLPEMEVLPHDKGGLLRLLAGATKEVVSTGEADASDSGATEADIDLDGGWTPSQTSSTANAAESAARLLTPDARAALRLLTPFLMTGAGVGFEARLPYDIDLR